MKNDQARDILLTLIRQHGVEICTDIRQCEQLIRKSYDAQYKREMLALLQTLRHGLVKQMLNAPPSLSKQTLLARLVRKLNGTLGMDRALAIWVAYSWGMALELIDQPEADAALADVPSKAPETVTKPASTRLEFRQEKITHAPDIELVNGKSSKLRSGRLCTFQGDITALSFGPDGQTVINDADNALHLLDSAMQTRQSNETSVTAICYSQDGQLFASGSWNTRITVSNAQNGRVMYTLSGHTHKISGLAFSPDRRLLASASWDGDVRLWNMQTGKLVKVLRHSDKRLFEVTFSPNGKLLVAAGEDGVLRIWELSKITHMWHRIWGSRALSLLKGHRGAITSVLFTPDGRFMVSGSSDGTVRIWGQPNFEGVWRLFSALRGTQTLHRLVHNAGITALALSPDGSTIAVGTEAKEIHLWDSTSGQHLRILKGHQHWVSSLTFNPMGKVLASGGSDQAIKLWDIASGELLRTIYQEGYRVTSVAFNPEGEIITSGSFDKTMVLNVANLQ